MTSRVAAFASLLLACVAAAAAATPAASFTPPPLWARQPAPAGVIGVWVDQATPAFRQNIVFSGARFSGSLSDYAAERIARLQYQLGNFRYGADSATRTCNGVPARYLSYGGIVFGKPAIMEQMLVKNGSYVYSLLYTRLTTQKSEPPARYALTTLCPAAPAAPRSARHAKPKPSPTPVPRRSRAPETPTPFVPASAKPIATTIPATGPVATAAPIVPPK